MKKRLLSLLVAMVAVVGAYAQYADYVYTKTAKYGVVDGKNLIANGDFTGANPSEGWNFDANYWQFSNVAGKQAIVSTGASASDAGFSTTLELSRGTYFISFEAKSDVAVTTAISGAESNLLDFYTQYVGDDGEPAKRQVAESVTLGTEWVTYGYAFTTTGTETLKIEGKNLPEGTAFTNFTVLKVVEVYDTRIVEKRMAFVEKLLEDPNFNVEAAADAHAALVEEIALMRELIETGDFDDIDGAESLVEELEEFIADYLNASSTDIATEDYFKYVTNLTTFPKYNRGQIADKQVIGGFKFYGGNWLHGQDSDFLNKQIQGSYDNGAGSVVLTNANLAAGKYYISAEMRNAYCSNSYAYTYTLESAVKAFVGSDSVALGTIVGEDYVKFYMVGELKEGETFEAGFWWDGPATGSAFNIKNFEVRAFVSAEEMEAKVKHAEAWKAFKAQYDAAVSAREKIVAMQADKANYPWEQDSLSRALTQWDPYFNAVTSWVTAEGEDAGVATTDELNEWAKYQGGEVPEDEAATYQVVRGYQNAVNYVTAACQPIADLTADIKSAESVRDDDMNVQGDKVTFQQAIDKAQGVLDNVKATTTDATRVADSTKIGTAREELAAAVEVFKKSAELTPVVDIDFSNGFEKVVNDEDGSIHYVVKGAAGEMVFPQSAIELADGTIAPNTEARMYGIGYGAETSESGIQCPGVLRVGTAEATVAVPEVSDEDVLRFQFDLWVGNLINRYVNVQLQNAAGERVAGFSIDRYNGVVAYNDFNNDANTGLDINKYVSGIGSSSASNVAICVDANKSSFDLIVNYKAQAIKGTVVNGKNGTCEGEYTAMNPAVTDTKVTKFVISSSYDNADRRCWFDNLKIYTYTSSVDGPIDSGINDAAVKANVSEGIYTLTGLKVQGTPQKGLYIINGKKVVIK